MVRRILDEVIRLNDIFVRSFGASVLWWAHRAWCCWPFFAPALGTSIINYAAVRGQFPMIYNQKKRKVYSMARKNYLSVILIIFQTKDKLSFQYLNWLRVRSWRHFLNTVCVIGWPRAPVGINYKFTWTKNVKIISQGKNELLMAFKKG